MNPTIIIPARLESTRLSRKLLRRVCGKSIIQHTYEVAKRVESAFRVIVATDSEAIANEVHSFGGESCLTGQAHTGTDRIAQAVRLLNLHPSTLIVNLQGDEPEMNPAAIDSMLSKRHYTILPDILTLATPTRSIPHTSKPSCVTVVFNQDNHALYFSRHAIPYSTTDDTLRYQHLGIYAYTVETLLRFTALPRSPLEVAENLEQLRALEAGFTIHVTLTEHAAQGIDTVEDLCEFIKRTGT